MGEIKKFTRSRNLDWIEFEIDGEVFKIATVAPAMAVLDVAAVNEAKDLDKLRIIMEFLDVVLEPDSATRFAARLKSQENPITIEQCSDVAVWAMEDLFTTDRPTTAPSPSPNGSETTGPSTTDGAGATVSTLEPKTQRVL
jgi:hypothetical protein